MRIRVIYEQLTWGPSAFFGAGRVTLSSLAIILEGKRALCYVLGLDGHVNNLAATRSIMTVPYTTIERFRYYWVFGYSRINFKGADGDVQSILFRIPRNWGARRKFRKLLRSNIESARIVAGRQP